MDLKGHHHCLKHFPSILIQYITTKTVEIFLLFIFSLAVSNILTPARRVYGHTEATLFFCANVGGARPPPQICCWNWGIGRRL